jgi:hypothetical protein
MGRGQCFGDVEQQFHYPDRGDDKAFRTRLSRQSPTAKLSSTARCPHHLLGPTNLAIVHTTAIISPPSPPAVPRRSSRRAKADDLHGHEHTAPDWAYG